MKLKALSSIVLALFLFYKDLGPGSAYYETVTKAILEFNIFW